MKKLLGFALAALVASAGSVRAAASAWGVRRHERARAAGRPGQGHAVRRACTGQARPLFTVEPFYASTAARTRPSTSPA